MTWSRRLLVLGIAAWIANALIVWLGAPPLGHDESQYAIAASDLLAGEPQRWFYLSSGMNALAVLGNLAGGGELAMRLPTLVLGIAFILVVAQLARRAFGDTTAAWAVLVLAGARQTVKWSPELLSDLPAATCMLAALLVIVTELERAEGPRWRTVIVGPLFAAAFYLRYASCVPVAIIVAATLLVGWRRILVRPWPVIAAAAACAALLAPHLLHANETMGSPLAILLESKSVPGKESFAAGLITYVTANPFTFYGLAMPPVLAAGLLAWRFAPRVMLLWLVAVGDVIAIGLITDAQARYIVLATTLLVILGADVLQRWIDARREPLRRGLIAACAVALLAVWGLTAAILTRHADDRRAGLRSVLTAAEAIRADAGGVPCFAAGYRYTQLEWYSGCRSGYVWPDGSFEAGLRIYFVHDRDMGMPPYLPGKPTPVLDVPGLVLVLRLDR